MKIDTRPRHRNSPRPAEKSAPGYLQWLRGRNCAVNNHDCKWGIEAAHVDHGGDKGMGTKASDRFAIPLCGWHHDKQHVWGRKTFELRTGVDMLALAAAYWKAWPGRTKWEATHGLTTFEDYTGSRS